MTKTRLQKYDRERGWRKETEGDQSEAGLKREYGRRRCTDVIYLVKYFLIRLIRDDLMQQDLD